MKHPAYPNRRGLLPSGCKDLIDCLPLGAENSDEMRDLTDPEEIDLLLKRAKAYMKEGHIEKAFILLDKALGQNPSYHPYVFEIKRQSEKNA